MKTERADWGRRQPPMSESSFELYAWFFMRVSGLLLVLLAVSHMFIMHVFNDTLNLDYEFVAARWDTPYWRAFDWLLLALSLLHGTNGLRVVLHDNISDQTVRKLSLSALYSLIRQFVFLLFFYRSKTFLGRV